MSGYIGEIAALATIAGFLINLREKLKSKNCDTTSLDKVIRECSNLPEDTTVIYIKSSEGDIHFRYESKSYEITRMGEVDELEMKPGEFKKDIDWIHFAESVEEVKDVR